MVLISDLILAAQQKCDQENSDFVSQSEWVWIANKSCGVLYDLLTNTNQDYNIQSTQFTLVGNSGTTNFLDVTTIGNYWKPRNIELYAPQSSSADPWVPLHRCHSWQERHKYARTVIDPYYGAPRLTYFDQGNKIEILPAIASAGLFQLHYIPQLPTFLSTDPIDGYWMAVNGWDEFIALDMAVKAAIKEESFDMAQGLQMQQAKLEASIIKSASARNASSPTFIADVTETGFPGGGFWGGGGGAW